MLKELTKIIHKANPSILDLKFGCKTDRGIITKVVGMELRLDGTNRYISKGQVKRGLVEILGRDITLEDVLVALGEVKYCIDAMGQMWIDHSDDDRKAQWVFNKSLENQSEDLIKFLHEILCK